MRVLPMPNVKVETGSLKVIRNVRIRACPPSQSVPVGGRLCQFVEGWKHIMNDPYVLSIKANGYRLHFTIQPLLLKVPWEIRPPIGSQKIQGMREQISLMLQKNAISEIPLDTAGIYSFEHIPSMQGF